MYENRVRLVQTKDLEKYLGKTVIVAADTAKCSPSSMTKAGFAAADSNGYTILPNIIGPVSRRNAEGYNIVHRDQPKETHYRVQEWSWKEFRGKDDYEEKTDYRDVPYQRYPRTFVEPPGIEVSIHVLSSGNRLLVSPKVAINSQGDLDKLKHIINLFLELFHTCDIFDEDLNAYLPAKIVRLNWEILPKGKYPWEERLNQLQPILDRLPPNKRSVITDRLKAIHSYRPDYMAVGKHGFSGYFAFVFEEKRLFVFESSQTNNATYVFDRNWEEYSRLTKCEILTASLQKYRVIHRVGSWHSAIKSILS